MRVSDESNCMSPTYDGYVYDVVEIGDQCWFAENLRSTLYANGDSIFHCPLTTCYEEWRKVEATGKRIEFKDDHEQAEVTGQLYNFWAVTDPRGLCPSGWKVPSSWDWFCLVVELGGEDVIWTEGAMVELENTLVAPSKNWLGIRATNSSGLGILPGGKFSPNGKLFSMTSNRAYLWSSTQVDEGSGFSVELGWGGGRESPPSFYTDLNHALSVRCLKDFASE